MRFHVVLLSVTLLRCLAAQPDIRPATLGYAYDSRLNAIRAIHGTPGAALLGDPAALDLPIAGAAAAPLQNYALALDSTGQVRILRGLAATPSADPLDAAPADRFFFSPSGAAAVLYDSGSGRMQLVTGLPDAPATRALPLEISARPVLAVRDDGAVAAAADDGVRIVTPDSNSFLLPIGAASALVFERSGARLAAVTASGEVYLAAGLDNGLDLRLAGTAALSGDIAGAEFAPDGSAVLLAATSGDVAAVDLATGAVQSGNCQCAPTALSAFGRPGLFRLTEISDRPLMLFEAAPGGPRFWFVPADAPRSAQ